MKDAVEAWKEDPSRQTDYQIARIMLAYGMHRMTDPLRGYPLLAGGTAGVVFLSGV